MNKQERKEQLTLLSDFIIGGRNDLKACIESGEIPDAIAAIEALDKIMPSVESWDAKQLINEVYAHYIEECMGSISERIGDFHTEVLSYAEDLSPAKREALEERYEAIDSILEDLAFEEGEDFEEYMGRIGAASERIETIEG